MYINLSAEEIVLIKELLFDDMKRCDEKKRVYGEKFRCLDYTMDYRQNQEVSLFNKLAEIGYGQ